MPKGSRASENQSENNYASVGSGIHWWTWPQEARKTAMEVGMGVLWISKKIRTQSCYLLTTHFVPSTYVLYIHFLIVSFLQDRNYSPTLQDKAWMWRMTGPRSHPILLQWANCYILLLMNVFRERLPRALGKKSKVLTMATWGPAWKVWFSRPLQLHSHPLPLSSWL